MCVCIYFLFLFFTQSCETTNDILHCVIIYLTKKSQNGKAMGDKLNKPYDSLACRDTCPGLEYDWVIATP